MVTAGATTSGINAGMGAGGSISGTIVADGSGSPLAGMCAVAFPITGGTGTSSPPTASDGAYVVAGVAVGTYRVRFNDCVGSVDYATEYYDNTQSLNSVTSVSVTAGPNLVVAKVGANGNVTVYNNQGSIDVIFDVVGWYRPAPTCFTSLTPARIFDSRSTTKIGPAQARDVKVTGVGGVPGSGVTAGC